MFQNTGGRSTVGKKLGSELFTGNSHTDGVFRHSNGTVSNETIKAKSGDVQNIRWVECHCKILIFNRFIWTTVVGIVQMSIFVTVNGHFIRHQWVQGNDFIFTVSDNLCIGITPKEQMSHECFAEYKRTHFWVRLIVEQSVKRMVNSFFFTAIVSVFVKV